MSEYGAQFDRTAQRWAAIENEHDRQHPDRGACGGVGACSMMFAANQLEGELVVELEHWRRTEEAKL